MAQCVEDHLWHGKSIFHRNIDELTKPRHKNESLPSDNVGPFISCGAPIMAPNNGRSICLLFAFLLQMEDPPQRTVQCGECAIPVSCSSCPVGRICLPAGRALGRSAAQRVWRPWQSRWQSARPGSCPGSYHTVDGMGNNDKQQRNNGSRTRAHTVLIVGE